MHYKFICYSKFNIFLRDQKSLGKQLKTELNHTEHSIAEHNHNLNIFVAFLALFCCQTLNEIIKFVKEKSKSTICVLNKKICLEILTADAMTGLHLTEKVENTRNFQ